MTIKQLRPDVESSKAQERRRKPAQGRALGARLSQIMVRPGHAFRRVGTAESGAVHKCCDVLLDRSCANPAQD